MVKSDISKWRISYALVVLLLSLMPLFAEAEISNPYVIDQKDTVDFGDAGFVTDGDVTYHGLQNYKYDYVNGYLHITYTITHQICCAAGYPPRVYVTNINPVGTTSISIKYNGVPYQPLAGHPTDWYSIDIQFNGEGFRFIAKEKEETLILDQQYDVNNLVDTDWVSLANLYPTPEGVPNDYSMAFTPLPLKEIQVTPPPPTKNPVIIIPGIMGTELVDINLSGDNLIWPNIVKIALSSSDDFLDSLILNSSGISTNTDILPDDILRKVSNQVYFEDLIKNLEDDEYLEGKSLFTFPYDWRLSNNYNAEKLKEKIEVIKKETGSSKVDIISHSMGGLVFKSYLKNYGSNSVEKFIDIATPHTGSPKSFKTLVYGDNLGISYLVNIFNLNSQKIKYISQNMSSIYELLPSYKYLNTGGYVNDLDDIDGNGIRGNLSFNQTKEFLKNTGRNSLLVDRADTFHQEIDNLNPADYGVDTYNIVGCGTPTLGKIFMLNKEASGGVEYNISFVQGDGTVPLVSAKSIPTSHLYYYKNAVHATMPSATGVKELVSSVLKGGSINPNDFNNISISESDCPKINGTIVSFHSPIGLNIYDSQNRHTGPDANGDIENNIPNIDYEVIDGNKFAFLPNGENYKIVGVSEGSGSFNTRIEKISNEEVIETKYFSSTPLTPITKVTFDIGSNSTSSISVDNNGDGVYESQILPSSVLNKSQSSDLTKPITNVSLKGNKTTDGSYISSVQATLQAVDDNSGVLKTEYSLNNGVTWLKYVEPFTINTRGGVKIIYKSTDKAGNVEILKFLNLNIIYPASSGNKK